MKRTRTASFRGNRTRKWSKNLVEIAHGLLWRVSHRIWHFYSKFDVDPNTARQILNQQLLYGAVNYRSRGELRWGNIILKWIAALVDRFSVNLVMHRCARLLFIRHDVLSISFSSNTVQMTSRDVPNRCSIAAKLSGKTPHLLIWQLHLLGCRTIAFIRLE